MEGFIEILPGIWYEKSTGKPWSTKKRVNNGECGLHIEFDGHLKPLNAKKCGYYCISVNNKIYDWHRLVYEYFKGKIPENLCIDHFNNNRLDNRIDNLRLVTQLKNNRKSLRKKNKTGAIGVVFHNDGRSKPYQARIVVNYKKIGLGYFSTPEEAHQAYLDAKIRYHGEESIIPLTNSNN